MITAYAKNYMKQATQSPDTATEVWLSAVRIALEGRAELTIGEAVENLVRINWTGVFSNGAGMTPREVAAVWLFQTKMEARVRAAILGVPGHPRTQAARVRHVADAAEALRTKESRSAM